MSALDSGPFTEPNCLEPVYVQRATAFMNLSVCEALCKTVEIVDSITLLTTDSGVSLSDLEMELNKKYFQQRDIMIGSILKLKGPKYNTSKYQTYLENQCIEMKDYLGREYTNIAIAATQRAKNLIFDECEKTLVEKIKCDGPYDSQNLTRLISNQCKSCSEMLLATLNVWNVPGQLYEDLSLDCNAFNDRLKARVERENASLSISYSSGKRSAPESISTSQTKIPKTSVPVSSGGGGKISLAEAKERAKRWANGQVTANQEASITTTSTKNAGKSSKAVKMKAITVEDDEVKLLSSTDVLLAARLKAEKDRMEYSARIVKEIKDGKRR